MSVDRTREEAVVEGNPDPALLVAAIVEEGYQAQVGS